MSDDFPYEPYEAILKDSLRDVVRVLSSYLPCKSKKLSDLLQEEHPHYRCRDGTIHLFKKKELNYLKSITSVEEQETLLLPILIEIVSEYEMMVICPTGIEERVVSRVLDTTVKSRENKILIYRPQLNLLRKTLKTTTQYIFPANK